VKGNCFSKDQDALGFILSQTQAILFATDYAKVGNQAKSMIRQALFVASKADDGEGDLFRPDLRPVQREAVIKEHYAKEYAKFVENFNQATGQRNKLARAFRQLGPIVLLDQAWSVHRSKSSDFWKIVVHVVESSVEMEDGMEWELELADTDTADAVECIARVLGGEVAATIVRELLDDTVITRLYNGVWT
jgi:hypothetical protein